jgi:hypothetical protein
VYSIVHNPTIDDTKITASGSGLGEFTANASELVEGKTYYIRAYATNSKGTVYGEEKVADFKAIAPQVETVSWTYTSTTTVYLIGKITNVGDPEYTERGFIYATIQYPTLDDASVTKVVVAKNSSTQFEKEVSISNLSSVTYYLRAYVKSSAGTFYGEVLKTTQEYFSYLQLPTFSFSGNLYRVCYDDIGNMEWQQAMDACDDLTYYGFTDWYLPSKSELAAMYDQKLSIGGFSNNYYWSSSEFGSSDAWCQNFNHGSQSNGDKIHTYGVRCVRKE